MQLPLTAYELIDVIDDLFPEVEYDPDGNREEFLLRAGERRLVNKLKRLRDSEVATQREGGRSR